MKEIMYCDFMYYSGHKRSNKNFIKALSQISSVHVLSQKNYFSEYKEELLALKNMKFIEKDNFELKNGQLTNRLSSLKIMYLTGKYIKKIQPSHIFVSSFDTVTFNVGKIFLGELNKVYLLHTINIDELLNDTKFRFFDSYKNQVNHLVFEQYMADYLVTRGVEESRVFVIPHPLNDNTDSVNMKKEFKCVGLSNSNDEDLIKKLVQYEIENSVFKNKEQKVVLKSKEIEFDNGYLKVFKGFLETDVYDNYINKSEFILIPFPTEFKYRMSGTLVDAFSNEKVVIGNNIPIIKHYSENYPEICKVYNNVDEIVKEFDDVFEFEKIDKEFKVFKKVHSEIELVNAFRKFIK